MNSEQRTPVGVIILERHGRVRTELKFPLHEQGRYPLTDEAKRGARNVGRKIVDYLREQNLLLPLTHYGATLHFAPTPYVRAVETGQQTALELHRSLLREGIRVQTAPLHQQPKPSLRFLQTTPLEHYPPAGSTADRMWIDLEQRWATGEKVWRWENKRKAEHRTRTPGRLRQAILNAYTDRQKQGIGARSLPIYAWVSHGPVTSSEKISEARSPLGFALKHLLTETERKRFSIPAELARGEAVAAIVYSDGSVNAKHLKP